MVGKIKWMGRWVIGAAAMLGLTLALASCASPADVSPQSAREKLTSTIEESAAILGELDWAEVAPADGGHCGDQPGERVDYNYWYNAPPQPQRDHEADARKMADHWTALGMDVRIVESPSHVVYATGGPVAGLSFSTAPGNYYIAGTSLCVPGDADEIRKQDNG
ncbi:hypothetical protein RWH44_15725 [Microbacterium sp. KSW2-29]|uniref:Lipoprotein n=1 Tax=Microbacterium phycohabitans TaxID=3075993 RepID=A0ABU3SQZ9_9MICO|nr:hypothetical protein [Microbacterium sp. KSW2-29]MDU0347149.1 hypothetical protein [Microbacterium sp. KSW2-29]